LFYFDPKPYILAAREERKIGEEMAKGSRNMQHEHLAFFAPFFVSFAAQYAARCWLFEIFRAEIRFLKDVLLDGFVQG
jgi:hypothetical protein